MDDTTDETEYLVAITFIQGYTHTCRMTGATLEQIESDISQHQPAGIYDARHGTLDQPTKVVLRLEHVIYIG